jgi:hypothetical protein
MTSITFDTHELIRELREADFTEKQAEAMVRVLSRSQDRLVSTEHFDSRLEVLEARIMGEIKVTRWMLAIIIAATVAPLLKNLL